MSNYTNVNTPVQNEKMCEDVRMRRERTRSVNETGMGHGTFRTTKLTSVSILSYANACIFVVLKPNLAVRGLSICSYSLIYRGRRA